MQKDQLYLLNPYPSGNDQTEFCRECAETAGLLEYYPDLKNNVDVRYIDPKRPRPELVELLGSSNQDCPVLVLRSCPANVPPEVGISQGNGRLFVDGATQIARYLSCVYGTGTPR